MKLLALDVGKARIGIAVCDTVTNIVTPHSTIDVHCLGQAVFDAFEVISAYQPDIIYIGMPLSDDGKPSNVAPYIKKFAHLMQDEFNHANFPAKIEFADERYTTKLAHTQMHEIGLQPSRNRDIVDQMAAVNILQSVVH